MSVLTSPKKENLSGNCFHFTHWKPITFSLIQAKTIMWLSAQHSSVLLCTSVTQKQLHPTRSNRKTLLKSKCLTFLFNLSWAEMPQFSLVQRWRCLKTSSYLYVFVELDYVNLEMVWNSPITCVALHIMYIFLSIDSSTVEIIAQNKWIFPATK